MAIELPTSRTKLDPRLWRRGRPILSGAADADADYGFRGISRALNHAYAERTRILASHWPLDDNPEYTDGTLTAATWRSCTNQQRVFIAPHVARLQLTTYATNGTVRLRLLLDGGSFEYSSGTTVTTVAKVTETLTIGTAPTAGSLALINIQYQRTAAQTFDLYGWEIAELPLQSAEMS